MIAEALYLLPGIASTDSLPPHFGKVQLDCLMPRSQCHEAAGNQSDVKVKGIESDNPYTL